MVTLMEYKFGLGGKSNLSHSSLVGAGEACPHPVITLLQACHLHCCSWDNLPFVKRPLDRGGDVHSSQGSLRHDRTEPIFAKSLWWFSC